MLSNQDVRMPAVSSNDDWIEESFDLVKFINTESPQNSQELNTPVMEHNPFPYGHDLEKGCNPYQSNFPLEDEFEFDQLFGGGTKYQQESPGGDEYTPNNSSVSAGSHYQVSHIKTEEFDPDYAPATDSLAKSDKDGQRGYVPKIKPRKYQLKSETERNSSTYKQKRAKNNDAVRKSRTKAKILQQQRDLQLHDYEIKVKDLQKERDADKKTMVDMTNEIGRLREQVSFLKSRPKCACNGFR
ncbi:hypothetical protein QR680_017241 [Steinernema hermaphroditum]|uniref:BZIP domain-containing protein n=1 Tax=Steinernema hermaphroditum TaxID=289476 RepID=A0AA39LNX7_9BILA|nr:hypothetical protein QR680_017241 [Steinernema hermaphroditum]